MVKKRAPRQRVGCEFDEFVKTLQRELEPIVGRKPSYPEVTNSIGGFMLDERTHERMIRKAKNLYRGRKPRRLF